MSRRKSEAPLKLGNEIMTENGKLRATYLLAGIAGVLMLVQSATGMLFFGIYRDQEFALEAWRLNDPITFFIAFPLVVVSLGLAVRGSLRGHLLLLGGLQYALYNYAFYLFGAALNVHFLLYVALLVVSALALITGLSPLKMATIGKSMSPRMPVKLIASYMAIWASILGIAWIGQSLSFAFTGQIPGLGDDPFRLIAALDLSLVVTPVALGAVWLWKRRGWGLVLAVVLNVKGVVYSTLLVIGSLTGGTITEGGADGLLGLWVFLALGSFGSLIGLLANLKSTDPWI